MDNSPKLGFLKLDKDKLVNLEYSLKHEFFRANSKGTYSSSTLIGCNTRKYHGLLVYPEDEENMHVLLSSVNETVEQHNDEFRLGVNKYPNGIYDPHGHRYLREIYMDPIPTKIYRVGGVVLRKQLIICQNEHKILIRYTILEAHSPTKLKIQPFVAFRHIHTLSKANMDADTSVQETDNGIKYRMYDFYPHLYMQTNLKNKFIHAPDWNYNIEYEKEQNRHYECNEDLFTPGYFVLDVKKDTEIIFSAGTQKSNTRSLKQLFNKEIKQRKTTTTFEETLTDAGKQFIIQPKQKKIMKTGYHWYNYQHIETLISLPGLCLANNDCKTFEEVLNTAVARFKNTTTHQEPDIPLFFFYTIQHYAKLGNNIEYIRKKYGNFLLGIIENFQNNKYPDVELHENGLLFVKDTNKPTTRLNEVIDGKPVVKRIGYINDINALWYNALMFANEIADNSIDLISKENITSIAKKIEANYAEVFYNPNDKNLYDYVCGDTKNTDVRPNQIFATSLPYSPVSDDIKHDILKNIQAELLTERGLRTLSPKNVAYLGTYAGSIIERKRAKHQGSVHPWLIGAFAEAWLKLHGKSGLNFIKQIYKNFENEIYQHGIGTISEIYDGNPPYQSRGAISYAPSVAEIIRTKKLIDDLENS